MFGEHCGPVMSEDAGPEPMKILFFSRMIWLIASATEEVGTSTMMSLFWDDIVKTEDAQMLGLRRSRYACVSVWIYCTLWFLLQDACKVLAYMVLEYLTRVDAERVKEVTARGAIAAMMDADAKSARSRGIGGAGAGSGMHMETELAAVGSNAAVETRLTSLEGEISEIKSLLRTALAGKVAA